VPVSAARWMVRPVYDQPSTRMCRSVSAASQKCRESQPARQRRVQCPLVATRSPVALLFFSQSAAAEAVPVGPPVSRGANIAAVAPESATTVCSAGRIPAAVHTPTTVTAATVATGLGQRRRTSHQTTVTIAAASPRTASVSSSESATARSVSRGWSGLRSTRARATTAATRPAPSDPATSKPPRPGIRSASAASPSAASAPIIGSAVRWKYSSLPPG
jgi:hypothetical protein